MNIIIETILLFNIGLMLVVISGVVGWKMAMRHAEKYNIPIAQTRAQMDASKIVVSYYEDFPEDFNVQATVDAVKINGLLSKIGLEILERKYIK
jgi:hypothetical protein